MTALNLSSEISVREELPQTRPIQAVSTSVLAALGVTERGPHAATKVTSYAEFLSVFGSESLNSYVPNALRAYFDIGGREAWVKRVVHYTDIDDAATKTSDAATVTLQSEATSPGAGTVTCSIPQPWVLAHGDTIIVKVDGGTSYTGTISAVAALVTGSNTQPFTMTDGMTLLVAVDGGAAQTISFLTSEFANIATATAAEVAAVINAKIAGARATVATGAVRITSDRKGTGSVITVTGGTSAAVLGLTGATNTGTGNVSNVVAVTAAEIAAMLELAVTGALSEAITGGYVRVTSDTTGGSSSIQVMATSTADDELGFDNAVHSGSTGSAADALVIDGKTDGAYANSIRIRVLDASNDEDDHFNLQVEDDGVVVEVFPNLTMAATTEERYALLLVNNEDTGSNLIALSEPTSPLRKRPANGLSSVMTGGNDGLTSLADTDYVGSTVSKTGLHGFDYAEDARILIAPGRATAATHLAMLTYCEDTREGSMFAVLDPPSGYDTSEVIEYVTTTAGLYNLSEYGVIYYPWIKVLNPDTALYGDDASIVVPPSGHIAGIYARTDAATPGGVYQPPAGVERGVVTGATGLESDETKDKTNRDRLYPKRINPISIVGGRIIVDGVRTLRYDSNFPTVAERRGVIFIEYSVKAGLEFARMRNNDAALRAEVRRTIQQFLIAQMNVGAFRSRKPAEAFLVDVGDELNPPSVTFAGQLIARIGLATQKPAEFINLIFSQDTRALDAELAAAGL